MASMVLMGAQIWILLGPTTPLIHFVESNTTVELRSRSVDLNATIRRLVLERKGVPVRSEWRSIKKGLSTLLSAQAENHQLRESVGLPSTSLSWQLLFRYSGGVVRLQPWVDVDYWLILEALEVSAQTGQQVGSGPPVSLVSLTKHIQQSPADSEPALQFVSELWPTSHELTFQFLGPSAEDSVARFVEVLKRERSVGQPGVGRSGLDPGEFPTWFVWSPAAINALRNREELLIEAVGDDKPVPSAQRYSTFKGTNAWLSLADISVNSHQAASVVRIEELADDIADLVSGNGALDFLSLGPGDGIKDTKLMTAMSRRCEGSVRYHPADISPLMIGVAVADIMKKVEGLEVMGVVADFTSKTSRIVDLMLRDRGDVPNMFSLLGNTLGNVDDDYELLRRFGRAMQSGDFLLLDLRRIERIDKADHEIKTVEARKNFYLDPLLSIGAKVDPRSITTSIDFDSSGATIRVICESVYHPGFGQKNVEVAKIKHYNRDFFEVVSDLLDADVLLRSVAEQTLTEVGVFRKR